MSEIEIDPYSFSTNAKAYVPALERLGRLEQAAHHPVSMVDVKPMRTETEVDVYIAEQIERYERLLVEYRYIQKIRLERGRDRNWLRKIMGF